MSAALADTPPIINSPTLARSAKTRLAMGWNLHLLRRLDRTAAADRSLPEVRHERRPRFRAHVGLARYGLLLSGDTYADPALSPDRSQIAYHTPSRHRHRADGRQSGTAADHGASALVSFVSPDGAWLALSQSDGWLYLIRADGSAVNRWTEGAYPAWRPLAPSRRLGVVDLG